MNEDATPQGEQKKVDEEWKERQRAEKERPGQPQAPEPKQAGTRMALKPSMEMLIATFTSNALICLGEIVNPVSKSKKVDLGGAKFAIDILQVIQDKTKGNLTEAEGKYLETVLYDLRLRYVAAAKQ